MATLARWQATIVDDAGNVVPGATITVLREIAGQPPAACFENRDGTGSLGSTFNADAVTGFVAFHVVGGAYKITATSGAFSREWRYVAIGRAAETDGGVVGVTTPQAWVYSATTADADPGSGVFRLNNASPASATAAYIDNLQAGGADVAVWLDTLDDGGDASYRGQVCIFDPDAPTEIFRQYAVTGSVVDGTGYRKLTLTHVAGAGAFAAGGLYSFSFHGRGVPGPLANVVEDTTPQLGGNLDTNGFSINYGAISIAAAGNQLGLLGAASGYLLNGEAVTTGDALRLVIDSGTMDAAGRAFRLVDSEFGVTFLEVNEFGQVGIRRPSGFTGDAALEVGTASDGLAGITVTANSGSQSANLQEWRSSAGAALARVTPAGGLHSLSDTAGVGYGTGAGGTQTQGTSKATPVTLDKITGSITTHNATLNAGASVTFTVNNSKVEAADVIVAHHVSGGTAGAYRVAVKGSGAAGSFLLELTNTTGGNLGQAIVINFAVIKGAVS